MFTFDEFVRTWISKIDNTKKMDYIVNYVSEL